MTTTDSELAALFLDSTRNRLFNEHWPRLKACVGPLTVDQIWWRPNEASNSIGNLILHLNGNVTQWIVTSFSRGEDERDRPSEFSAAGGLTATELLDRLGATLNEAEKVIGRLTADELLAPFEIQGYKTRGLDAVYHVVDHFGLHYGQIAYITKNITAKDLGFYKELNKTSRATH
jgi:uncharacterized damage-inducible protein DinB